MEQKMEMYIGLHIAHKMSIEQRLTLRQSLELLLKQELRQELKLAIKQLLTLFQNSNNVFDMAWS